MTRMRKADRIKRARQAGSATSEAKSSAARANGAKGGRPANPEIKRIMAERGCSRQRAHQILHGL